MKKNHLLLTADIFCKCFSLLLIAGFLIISIVLVHWHIDREFYSKPIVTVENIQSGFLGTSSKSTWKVEGKGDENPFALNKIKPFSLYLNYLRLAAIIGCTLLIFREFSNILSSVKKIQTFRTRNIDSFRKMGKYHFFLFLLTGFVWVVSENGNYYSFGIHFTPLILMLVSYILAEVFKEGSILSMDNKLTI